MRKIVTVTSPRRMALTPTQAAVIIALKRSNYTTATRFVESIINMLPEQIDTLISNVNGEYDDFYIYDEVSEDKEITQAEYDFIHFLLTLPDRQLVASIKFLRAQYGWGLEEAEDVVDAITTTSL